MREESSAMRGREGRSSFAKIFGVAVAILIDSTAGVTSTEPVTIAKRCEPHSDLKHNGQRRADWIKQRCTELRTGVLAAQNATVAAGEYKHYHWVVDDYALVKSAGGGRVSFVLTPCRGRSHLFVKPAVLRNGRAMDQLFETNPDGTMTDTWPFPDKQTGVIAQPPDQDLTSSSSPSSPLPATLWGRNGTQSGFENVVTFRLQHGSYFISVYGAGAVGSEEESSFQLTAVTHSAMHNPLLDASQGKHLQRRRSLQALWDKGRLKLMWNTTGGAADDLYQLMMLKGSSQHGICNVTLARLLSGASPNCVMTTPCGVEGAGETVGRAFQGKDASPGNGGYITVDLQQLGIIVEDKVPYYYTVVRTPADPTQAKELFVGLDTSSSYNRVKQVQSDTLIATVGAACIGAIGVLAVYIQRVKRQTQIQLYAVYQDASAATPAHTQHAAA